MEFEVNIKMGKPQVRGVNSEYSGLLDVDVPLSPRPDRYWTQIFNDGPPNVPFSISMHPPRLSGGTVHLRPPDNEVEKYIEYLERRIEGTNQHYNERVASQLKREHEAKQAGDAEQARRIEEAQRRLEQHGDESNAA